MFRRVPRLLMQAGLPPIAVLGLQRDATPDQIRRAYRLLVKKHHPDTGGDRRRFEEIQEAYEKLEEAQWDTSIGAMPTSSFDGTGPDPTAAGFDPTQSPVREYTKGREAALIRLVLVWCAFFSVTRLVLQRWVFPPPSFKELEELDLQRQQQQQTTVNANGVPAATNFTAAAPGVQGLYSATKPLSREGTDPLAR
jgi:hypothetical protein